MRLEKTLLVAGLALPILYFANVFGSSLFYPGYSHITQYASEMGSNSATYPAVFNTGVMLVGVAAMAAGAGFFLTLRRLSINFVLLLLVGVCMVLFGVSFIMAGIFPMPDERHNAFGMAIGIHLVPLLLVVALWKYHSLRLLTLFILVNALILIALFAIMIGAGDTRQRGHLAAHLCLLHDALDRHGELWAAPLPGFGRSRSCGIGDARQPRAHTVKSLGTGKINKAQSF
jgi:hypothetical membrane protein